MVVVVLWLMVDEACLCLGGSWAAWGVVVVVGVEVHHPWWAVDPGMGIDRVGSVVDRTCLYLRR